MPKGPPLPVFFLLFAHLLECYTKREQIISSRRTTAFKLSLNEILLLSSLWWQNRLKWKMEKSEESPRVIHKNWTKSLQMMHFKGISEGCQTPEQKLHYKKGKSKVHVIAFCKCQRNLCLRFSPIRLLAKHFFRGQLVTPCHVCCYVRWTMINIFYPFYCCCCCCCMRKKDWKESKKNEKRLRERFSPRLDALEASTNLL